MLNIPPTKHKYLAFKSLCTATAVASLAADERAVLVPRAEAESMSSGPPQPLPAGAGAPIVGGE